MDNKVSYQYSIGQTVYFMHEGKACVSRIHEVSINIIDRYRDDDGDYCDVVKIKYRVNKDLWMKENELFENKDFFNKYVNSTKPL